MSNGRALKIVEHYLLKSISSSEEDGILFTAQQVAKSGKESRIEFDGLAMNSIVNVYKMGLLIKLEPRQMKVMTLTHEMVKNWS